MALIELNSSNFNNEIADGITVVDFWAPWCGPCKMIAPVIDELAGEMDNVRFAKVNIDDNQDIAAKFNVMSIPTLIIFKEGKPVTSTVGIVSKKALKSKIDSVL